MFPPPDGTLLAVLNACFVALVDTRNHGLAGNLSEAVYFSQRARVLHPIVSALPHWDRFDAETCIAAIIAAREGLPPEFLPRWDATIGPLTQAQVPLVAS